MYTVSLPKKEGSFVHPQKSMTFVSLIEKWMERHHQRKQLAKLSQEQLDDLGLDAQQVSMEIHKPFWK